VKQADDVIENTADLDRLRRQVESLHWHYLEKARTQP
jgi:dephospho-CoA kinase